MSALHWFLRHFQVGFLHFNNFILSRFSGLRNGCSNDGSFSVYRVYRIWEGLPVYVKIYSDLLYTWYKTPTNTSPPYRQLAVYCLLSFDDVIPFLCISMYLYARNPSAIFKSINALPSIWQYRQNTWNRFFILMAVNTTSPKNKHTGTWNESK